MGTTAQKLQAILDSKTAIKNAINNVNNAITGSTPLDEYASQIDDNIKSIFEKTCTSLKTSASSLPANYFYNNTILISLELTEATDLSINYSIYNIKNLTTLKLPEVTGISSNYNIYGSPDLTTLELPELQSITGGYALNNIGVIKINDTLLPNLTVASGTFLFSGNSNLTEISLSNITGTIGSNFGQINPQLELCDLSNCTFTSVGNYFLRQSGTSTTNGVIVKMPSTCSNLSSNFMTNAKLKELWLPYDSGVIPFPFITYNIGSHIPIYVPANLVSSYQTATNWSNMYNNGYCDFIAIPE